MAQEDAEWRQVRTWIKDDNDLEIFGDKGAIEGGTQLYG
jgi:hypothetical protein